MVELLSFENVFIDQKAIFFLEIVEALKKENPDLVEGLLRAKD